MMAHQAFFGDRDGSHNLILSSIDNSELIGYLKSVTDNPANIHYLDYAYICGYRIGEFYIFSKTMNDKTAKRGGMVFAHCLIFSIEQLNDIENLQAIFLHFVDTPQKNLTSLSQVNINTGIPFSIQQPDLYSAIVYCLLRNKTVIYPGYENFELIIVYLWFHLPNSVKRNFSFGISGSPDQLQDISYNLIYTPENLLSKWGGYTIISNQSNISDGALLADRLLSGNNSNDLKLFNEFISGNEILPDNLNSLSDAAKCYELYNRVLSNPDFRLLRSLIPILQKLLPDTEKGKEIKCDAINKFITALANVGCAGIKSLRNLDLKGYDDGQQIIEDTVKSWCDRNIAVKSKLPIPEIASLLTVAIEDEHPNWWNTIIQDKLKKICKSIDASSVLLLWNMWQVENSLIQFCRKYIDSGIEKIFVNSAPETTNNDWHSKVCDFALQMKWYRLFGLSAVKIHLVHEALALQLNYDNSAALYDNLLFIAQTTSSKKFVLASVEINTRVVHKVSGEVIAKELEIFSCLDVLNINWQTIWLESYSFTKDISKGIKDIEKEFYKLLDLNIQQKGVNSRLLELIEPQIEHIFAYPERKGVWSTLSVGVKNKLLRKVAKHIFENHQNIDFNALEVEILMDIRQQQFIETIVVTDVRFGVKHKMSFLEKAEIISEGLSIMIVQQSKAIEYFEIEYIANKINENHWKRLLGLFFRYRGSNGHIILQECRNLLSKWDKWAVSKNSEYVSVDQITSFVDSSRIAEAFNVLDRFTHEGQTYQRLRAEYMAGLRGIDFHDFCGRLKTYIYDLDR